MNLLAEFLRRIFPVDHHTGKAGIIFDDANKIRLIGGKYDFEPAIFLSTHSGCESGRL